MNVEKILLDSMNAYENGEFTLDDAEYDAIEEYALKNRLDVPKYGGKGNDIKLPYMMASLQKIKGKDSDVKLNKWMNKNRGEYLILNKFDGLSAMLVYKNGDLKIYGRGDGCHGQDLTFIKHFIDFPNIEDDVAIKGELIIHLKDFAEIKKSLVSKDSKIKGNKPRNYLAGLLSRKERNDDLRYINFYAFDIINIDETPLEIMNILSEYRFNISPYSLEKSLNVKYLEDELKKRRKELDYEIDGLVIRLNQVSEQVRECSSQNDVKDPTDQIAFKVDTYEVARVVDVKWSMKSRYGRLIPVIVLDKVEVLGSSVENPTGKNAKFVFENRIGIGALVTITLGGDIIPDIVTVIEPSDDIPLPDRDYEWDGVDFVLIDKNSDEIKIQKIVHFFSILNVKHVGEAMIKKLYDKGLTEIEDYLNIDISVFDDIKGLGRKSGAKLIDGLREALENVDYPTLMSASGIFGRGIALQRFNEFVKGVDKWYEATYEDIIAIKGFGEVLSKMIDQNLNEFIEFVNRNNIVVNEKDEVKGDLIGQSYAFTGFRDADLEKKIIERGGEFHNTVKKSTKNLIVKDMSKITNKVEEAIKNGVNIILLKDFTL